MTRIVKETVVEKVEVTRVVKETVLETIVEAVLETVCECTLLGCSDALTIRLKGDLPETLTVHVTDLSNTSVTVDCTQDRGKTRCKRDKRGAIERIEFPDYTPCQATFTFYLQGRTVTKTITPNYAFVYPNGRYCPPRCKTAEVTIDLEH